MASLLILVSIAILGSAFINAQPGLTTTGLTRLYAPWSDARWPQLTAITDSTPIAAHPSDTPFPLRVRLTKSNRDPGQSRITASYSIIDGSSSPGDKSETILVPQPALAGESEDSELYERLIDPAQWGRGRNTAKSNADRFIEYTIRSEDDRTATRRIRIVDPPVLQNASVVLTPPAYASLAITEDLAGGPKWLSGTIPTPTTEASLAPVLLGTSVGLHLEYSKPVTPDSEGFPEAADVESDGNRLVVSFSPEEPIGLSINATDSDGFETREPYRARFAVIADRPPTATVLEPISTLAVLPTAVIPVSGRAEDDLGLEALRIEFRLASPDDASLSREPEPTGDPVIIASVHGEIGSAVIRTKTLPVQLDIAATGALPGEELWLWAVATDSFDLFGERHDPVYSSPRRIRVIEESRFIEILQDELEGVRRNAISLDRRQESIMEDAAKEGGAEDRKELEDLARRQADLARRLRAQTASIESLQGRVDQNRLQEAAVRALIESAAQAADAASDSAEQAAGQSTEQAAGVPERDPTEARQRVRDSLASLIDRLDRGQDDWVVRRAIERLAEAQRELREQTNAIGEQTVGQELSGLAPDERTELERIADRQRELAERTEEAIDDLSQRAEELRDTDPTQASALEQAARAAQRQQLAQTIRDAADQVSENQTGEAASLQDQSIEGLESILEGLENAQRMRDQALRRELASLIESIESLIRQQRAAIDAIDNDPESAGERAERVRTNTLATAASATGFDELGPVAALLDRAGESQLVAIRALRMAPAATEDARGAEADALARLEEALAESKKQDEDAAERERERQRRELLEAYTSVLQSQTTLRDEASVFRPGNLSRRDRAQLRALGRDQEALRVEISQIPDQHDLPEGGVTDLYHDRIDRLLGRTVRRLGRGETDSAVLADQDAALELLRAIVETLSPTENPEEPFDDQQAGGGGGGSGGAGQEQPMIGQLEELRLLRALQQLVLGETRSAGARSAEPDAALAETQRQIAEQARRIIESMQENAPNPVPPETDRENGPEQPGPGEDGSGAPAGADDLDGELDAEGIPG